MNRMTWDNAAFISEALAKRMGIANEDVIELRYRGRSVQLPAWILPGQAESSVTVFLGFGRRRAGRVGNGVGVNVYPLRTSDAPWFGTGLEVFKMPRRHRLAQTQHHFNMEGRALVRVGGPGDVQPEEARLRQDPRAGPRGRRAGREPLRGPGAPARPRERRGQRLGHGDQPQYLHRLQRLRDGLPGGEQHPGRRQGAGARLARDALDPHRPLLRGRRRGGPRHPLPAGALHALREGPVRARLPGRRDDAQRRGAQRDDLQPLRRHAVLLEQLPVQGPPVQLLAVFRRDHAEPEADAQPRRDGPPPRGDGEVHVLRAADQHGADQRRDRGPRGSAATRS